MSGVQKLFYLPEPHTDFIYAVIAEELGLIGATCILLCFCVIAWRGLRIASRAQDAFGALLAAPRLLALGPLARDHRPVTIRHAPRRRRNPLRRGALL